MAFDDLDEHEQGELVRKWLRENSMAIVVGVALGLAALFGWRYWQSYQIGQQAEAALQFGAITKAVEAEKISDADVIAAAMQQNFPKSTYSVLAALGVAERAVAKNDLDAADKALAWAEGHVEAAELKQLIALRQARVTLARGKADDALKHLDAMVKGNYPGLVADLRGDALYKLDRADEARAAYQDALANVDPRAPSHALIQMKLDRIPPAAAAAAKAVPASSTTPATTAEKKDS